MQHTLAFFGRNSGGGSSARDQSPAGMPPDSPILDAASCSPPQTHRCAEQNLRFILMMLCRQTGTAAGSPCCSLCRTLHIADPSPPPTPRTPLFFLTPLAACMGGWVG